ncbi:MAG TPA: hypothetical protein VIU46_06520 [Gallionellaceae bacterium]
MKNPLIFLLIVSLVLAQGLRLCVHAPDTTEGGVVQSSHVHYESLGEPEADDSGYEFEVSYVLQGLDSYNLLAGVSALTLLLFSLLLMAGQGRHFQAAHDAARRSADGFRLRPPLRAPPC